MKVKPHIEMELNNTVLMARLDEIAPYIPEGTSNDELYRFIRSAFNLVNAPALRAGKTGLAVWECEPRFLELLPALHAGELSFCGLNDILDFEIRVGNKSHHDSLLS
jgi:hypothetical protein